jgi:hypothetical protein
LMIPTGKHPCVFISGPLSDERQRKEC